MISPLKLILNLITTIFYRESFLGIVKAANHNS